MTVSRRATAAAIDGRSSQGLADGRRVDDVVARRIGERLRFAEDRARAIASPMRGIELDASDAYAIQAAFVKSHDADGRSIRGYKVGLAADPAYGVVFEGRVLPNEATLEMTDLIRPAVEVEVGFVLRDAMRGPGVTTREAIDATAYVVACLEIVDSRISGRSSRWAEVVADNGRAARVVVGDIHISPRALDLRLIGAVLERNGVVMATGAGAAVLGNPAASVAWLANELGRQGKPLAAGLIVLSGALIPAIPARAGDEFRASVGGLGDVACRLI